MFRFSRRPATRAARSTSRAPQHGDQGQRLRRILIVWFCLWLAIILLAWNAVETGAGPDAEHSVPPLDENVASP